MGNKSKTQGKKQDKKWAQRRDMGKARQPKSWTQWAGMQPRALAPQMSVVVTAEMATASPKLRAKRHLHVRHMGA